MSDQISNGDLMNVLRDISRDLGGLTENAKSNTALLEKHDLRITSLEAGANRQKGAARVVLMAGTALGTIGGVVATWLTGKH